MIVNFNRQSEFELSAHKRESAMAGNSRRSASQASLTRRDVLAGGAASLAQMCGLGDTTAVAAPDGPMTLAWHTQYRLAGSTRRTHDGSATPDNFLIALHDALIKNFHDQLYDHLALAEHFEFAEDAKSATFRLRRRRQVPQRRAGHHRRRQVQLRELSRRLAATFKAQDRNVEIVDDRTIRFHFKEPFLDFPLLLGTGNVCGAGWVVPAKYYQKVGPDGFMQKPIGAGPYRLVSQEPGTEARFRGLRGLLPAGARQALHDPQRAGGGDPASRCSSAARPTSSIPVPGELLTASSATRS